MADHPHAGGEYARTLPSRAAMSGPSPRGWGILLGDDGAVPGNRTIPTRVGNTMCSYTILQSRPDHPHAGGEYFPRNSFSTLPTGPSPRGWGIHARGRWREPNGRTIPTRVGNTAECSPRARAVTDHPHAGGEYLMLSHSFTITTGPSPSGWGIPWICHLQSVICRTIPTRVGNTARTSATAPQSPDHPHAGGEYAASNPSSASLRGPSPRGWGILSPRSELCAALRTIPTRVGNTCRAEAHR